MSGLHCPTTPSASTRSRVCWAARASPQGGTAGRWRWPRRGTGGLWGWPRSLSGGKASSVLPPRRGSGPWGSGLDNTMLSLILTGPPCTLPASPGPSRSAWTSQTGRWRLLMLKTKSQSLLSAWLHVLGRGYAHGSGWGWTRGSSCVPDVAGAWVAGGEIGKANTIILGLGAGNWEGPASCQLLLTWFLWPPSGRTVRSWRWTPPKRLLHPHHLTIVCGGPHSQGPCFVLSC